MADAGGGHCSLTVSIAGVVTERCAQFAVLCVDGRNVGVFAWTGLMDRCRTVWTGRVEFGCRAVKVWYQWGERSMSCHTSARRGVYMAVLAGALLWGKERGMLR